MKIAPVSLSRNSINIQGNLGQKKSENNPVNLRTDSISYFDIPFTSVLKKDTLYTRASNALISEIKAEKEVEQVNQHAFSLFSNAQEKIDDVVDKVIRAQISGFDAYHDADGNVERSFKFDGKKVVSMKEYENGDKVRKAKIFDDGSIKINDYKNNEIIFADSNNKVVSVEKVSKDLADADIVEKIYTDGSRFKYTHVKRQIGHPAVENSFVYSNSPDDNKTNLVFFKNVVGKSDFKPKNCEYVISFQKDSDSDLPFSTILYLSDLKLSPSGKNYNAKNGLFYTFDAVLLDVEDICSGVISDQPITYNEGIKLPSDFDFTRGVNIESEITMMHHDGSFNKLPV